MRLLLLVSSTERGGAEEHLLTVGAAAARLGWEVHAGFSPLNFSLAQSVVSAGLIYHPLEIDEGSARPWTFKGRLQIVEQAATALAFLRRLKPDVVLLALPLPAFSFGIIMACGLLKMPTAVVFHLYPTPLPCSQKKRSLYLWAKERNQQWIAISKSNLASVCQSVQIPAQQVRLIHNGVKSPQGITEAAVLSARQSVRDELGLSKTAYVALTVARLSNQKDHAALIEAIPHIVGDFPGIKFVWAGGGLESKDITAKLDASAAREHVLVLGHRTDVSRLLLAADLFIFPTKREGLPFAVLEAMAHNLPVVAAAVGGIPEVIEHNNHGLLYRAGDSSDLAETIRWALLHPEQMKLMAINGKLRIEQEFLEETMISETLATLEKLGTETSAARLLAGNI